MNILKKIEQLFQFRRLPYLMDCLDIENKSYVYNKLIKLQLSIYKLDHYLETHWDLEDSRLKELHQSIFSNLETFDYSLAESIILSEDILKYESHEIQLRKGILPIDMDMVFFYHYKSCDVRLIRQILIDHSKARQISPEEKEAFRLFDLVTEINDDVSDLEEDLESINGNAFLISLQENGVALTKTRFTNILQQIKIDIEEGFNEDNSDLTVFMNQASLLILDQTLSLLTKKLDLWENGTKHIKSKLYMLINVN